ncbi:FeoA family protein [Anaerosoma tenue]|uniref:FeoA family protein n=1 Tax=Anaerosoma tenue TaxID=2933588 RepID=UPI002260A10B|nr:FeoA family protein [Anaerosoma tenue]MCK8115006.1 ferrous iron transport protein A [Anaerosoma tenue]
MWGRGMASALPQHAAGDTLLALRTGEMARIAEILGGPQLEARLGNMGLRLGKQVTKAGAMPAGGPVTVECDGFRVALGRGIAGRVRVEPLQDPSAPAGREGAKP